jgi:hypothetical protein
MAIPAEQAPALHRCKTVGQLQDQLLECITDALTELVTDPVAALRGPLSILFAHHASECVLRGIAAIYSRLDRPGLRLFRCNHVYLWSNERYVCSPTWPWDVNEGTKQLSMDI